MKKTFFLLFVLQVVLLSSIAAQELTCEVVVNDERVQTQERQIFREMEKEIASFINNTKWTNDTFKEAERIKCNIYITLQKTSTQNTFDATVQIQSQRPVYGTDYNSQLLNFVDAKWQFDYSISQPLIFSENTYSTELTSLLAYYAYIIIGVDYDSFSMKGGNPYFTRALNILNNSQQTGGQGWNAFGDTKDRYWLVTNLTDTNFAPFRDALYTYHRMGMDLMGSDAPQAKKKLLEALLKIKATRDKVAISVTLDSFFIAKGEELVSLFTDGEKDETKEKVLTLLVELDPANSSKYRKLLK